MPTLANITIKKNDGTTDITFTGVVPSSGDNTPAVWKSQSVGTAQAHQPEARLSARDSDQGKRRTLRATIQFPETATDSTTGITTVINKASFNAEWNIPKEMSATNVNEFASQVANLLDSTLFVDCVKAGYSAS